MADGLTDVAATSADTSGLVTRTGSKDGEYVWTATIDLKQTQDGWQSAVDEIGGQDMSATNPKKSGTCTVQFSQSTNACTITFSE